MKKLCCPKCKNTDLQYVSTSSTQFSATGGGFSGGKGCLGFLLFGPLGLLCGSCGQKQKITSTTTIDEYWICRGCGEKFPDINHVKNRIKSLEKEIDSTKSTGKVFFISSIIFALLGLFLHKALFIVALIFAALYLLFFSSTSIKSMEKLHSDLIFKRNQLEKQGFIDERDV